MQDTAQVAPSHNMAYQSNGYLSSQSLAQDPENKIRQIGIRQLSHGYLIEVGCQTFAIEKPSDLIARLSEYINDPLGTEKKWQEGKLF